MPRKHLSSVLAVLALSLSVRALAADAVPAIVQPTDLVGVVGDSITEQRIYSAFIEDYLLMCKPVQNVRAMQFGWSGDTTWGFYSDKLHNDVLRYKPTVVTTCFGMNDGAYNALGGDVADHYRSSTQSIIDDLKAAGTRSIIIGSPGCVGDELRGKKVKAEEYNKTLASLRDIDKDLAQRNGLIFADVFTPMMEVKAKAQAKYGPKYQLCGKDGIHPDLNGHLVMAYAFLKAMGFDGNIGTITVDMTAGKSTASAGHHGVKEGMDNGAYEAEFESSRYPFCFLGAPESSAATSGVIEFLPFNQDLNRFTLVVKNSSAQKLKVTWGETSKEFAAADLAKGINLAAEFLDNPFKAQFMKVNAAVFQKQTMETLYIKNTVYNIPNYEKMVAPQDRPLIEAMGDSFSSVDKAVGERVASMVTPVHHTIRIEVAK